MAAPKTAQIVPSLLAADLASLGARIRTALSAGVEWISVDVMDGHFVPNLSFGPDHVRMAKSLGVPIVDAHLMVSNPQQVSSWFIEAGADIVTVHLEACAEPRKILREIRRRGVKAGLAIKPRTPAQSLIEFLDELDLALIMTVEPGFGGAKFIDAMLPKIKTVRQAIVNRGVDCWLQVDGGINGVTAPAAAAAGADSLVAGSAVFAAQDMADAFKKLQDAIKVRGRK
ncbi:MAG: ribulose-phosphate 3-epimerase [Elusimicrobia bacterium RIFCSPHIGHO2_02_FULL_57_9]|nr:MAG: ribulose-phosphate 3-epimerase [Elusimicrobia bacterium RIFCSPHIGHO2_02_FULL_57_9]